MFGNDYSIGEAVLLSINKVRIIILYGQDYQHFKEESYLMDGGTTTGVIKL